MFIHTKETNDRLAEDFSATAEDEPEPSGGGQPLLPRKSMLNQLQNLLRFTKSSEATLRETLEEYIEDQQENGHTDDPSFEHERMLLSNTLKLRNLTVDEVMVPRADIKALEISTPQKEILQFFTGIQVSRVPVYRENLDDVVGTIHLKDIVARMAQGKAVKLDSLLTDVPVVAPSMPLLDLLLQMRQNRRHMALAVDEYGGIDGLITIGDIIEAIVGEIDDEHDTDEDHGMVESAGGSVLASARTPLEDFEARYGSHIVSEEEREENDTLGGLVFYIAGRVPVSGEILSHESGMEFEIVDADPRRINRLRIRNIPDTPQTDEI